MALPKIKQPIISIHVPSLQRTVKFRPYTVKEDKILMMAKESDTPDSEILKAVYQIVNNCILPEELDRDKVMDRITIADLEWMFLKLFESSVSSSVTQAFKDKEDGEVYEFNIKLSDVKAPVLSGEAKVFQLSDNNSVSVRYPPAGLYIDDDFLSKNTDQALMKACTVQISDETKVYTEFTIEELDEYYDQFDVKTMTEINEYISSCPQMVHTILYVNKAGNERKIELSALTDFFTF